MILSLRGQKVILDADLAELYGVSTGRFNEQVKRNVDRFPEDFMFQLTAGEWANLKSQIAILRLEVTEKEAVTTTVPRITKTLLQHDEALQILWAQLQPLLAPPAGPPKPSIGFKP
jgi:phosphotransferase system HPr-like phosphotransfer protein